MKIKQFLCREKQQDSIYWGAWRNIGASDMKSAAERFVEVVEWESVEFRVGSGQFECHVQVQNDKGTVNAFVVSGEARPIYTAKIW